MLEAVPKDCLFKESRRRRINERGQEDEQLPRMAEHVSLIQRRSRDYSRFDFFREPSRCSSSVIFDILLHVARPSRRSFFSQGRLLFIGYYLGWAPGVGFVGFFGLGSYWTKYWIRRQNFRISQLHFYQLVINNNIFDNIFQIDENSQN